MDWEGMMKLALDPHKARRYRQSSAPPDPEVCTMCGRCAKACPVEAVSGKPKTKKEKGIPFKIDEAKCIKCGMCFESCKFEAVEVQ